MNNITPTYNPHLSVSKLKSFSYKKLSLAAALLLSFLNVNAQSNNDQEGEYFGLVDGRPYFHISAENIELSGTGNEGSGIGLTAGFESYKRTALGTPNISLSYVFADLDNNVEYDSLALMGGFRGFGTKIYPVYGLGVARKGVKYSFGENTSFNQFVYYGGIGARIGNSLTAAVVYSSSTPLGEDDSNPANESIDAISLRLGYGMFSASGSF